VGSDINNVIETVFPPIFVDGAGYRQDAEEAADALAGDGLGIHSAARTICADDSIAAENGFHPRDQACFELEEAIDSLSRVLTTAGIDL
jgi:hypothetical protein